MTNQIAQLWPATGDSVPLHGLYLRAPLLPAGWTARTFVYSNFVASLDGRIALPDPATGLTKVPNSIANPRDWRLFQELAAQADLLLSSGGYLREFAAGIAQDSLPLSNDPAYADLFEWRRQQGLADQPDVAVLSNSLDFTLPDAWLKQGRRVLVLTTADPSSTAAQRLRSAGATIVPFAGPTVAGAAAIDDLGSRGYRRIYAIGGPHVLRTLLADNVLDTLFLTTVHRLLGGTDAPGFLEGATLSRTVDLQLSTLYYDAAAHDGLGQTFARYDRRYR